MFPDAVGQSQITLPGSFNITSFDTMFTLNVIPFGAFSKGRGQE